MREVSVKILSLACLIYLILIYSIPCLAGGSATVLWRPHKLTQRQLEFAAEHFSVILLGSGQYGALSSETLHRYNPNITTLSYLNSRQVINDSAFHKECALEPYLFAVDENDNRIERPRYNSWLMDIDHPRWLTKLAEWAYTFSPEIDGIFLDDASPLLHSGYASFPAGYMPDRYAESMKRLIADLKKLTGGMIVFNGLKGAIDCNGYLENADGSLFEGFIFNNHLRQIQEITPETVYEHLKYLIEAAKTDRLIILSTESYRDNIHHRIFAFASYLLGAGPNTVYNFMDIDNEITADPQYYPEYTIDLGSPLSQPNTIEDLIDLQTELLVRHFEHGMVLVNPWDFDVSVSMPPNFQEITLHGGGLVDKEGAIEAGLGFEALPEHVAIPAKSAKILQGELKKITVDYQSSIPKGSPPFTVAFANLSEGDVRSWLWDFGDGETSTEKEPFHTFPAPGTYRVTLTAYGLLGADMATKTIDVQIRMPLPQHIIVDNTDPGTDRSGYWRNTTQIPQSWDGSSIVAEWGGASFSWTADVKGKLKVYMWWPNAPYLSKRARIDAYDGDKYVGAVYIDQTKNGGRWNVLGTHTFLSYPRLVLHGTRWTATCADAVKFEPLIR